MKQLLSYALAFFSKIRVNFTGTSIYNYIYIYAIFNWPSALFDPFFTLDFEVKTALILVCLVTLHTHIVYL